MNKGYFNLEDMSDYTVGEVICIGIVFIFRIAFSPIFYPLYLIGSLIGTRYQSLKGKLVRAKLEIKRLKEKGE